MLKNRFITIVFCMLLIPLVFMVAFNGKEEKAKAPEEVAAPAEMPAKVGTQKERAEALGKKHAGATITMIAEGISTGPHKAYAPLFEKATGIKVKVVDVPFEEQRSKPFTEHEARTGAVDVYRMDPSWIPDFAAAGIIIPLDDMIAKYMTEEDFADMEPGRRIACTLYQGKTWTFLYDGDIFILYYRADIFEDPDAKKQFKAKYGYELAPPKNWEQLNQIGAFITDFTDEEVYGYGGLRAPGQAYYQFLQMYLGAGGKRFDPDTMKPLINGEVGRQTMQQMLKELEYGPPGLENWGTAELWSGFVDGKIAMQFSWPPSGRFAEAASGLANYPTWLPPTKVAGKIKYALLPGPFKGDGPPAAGLLGNAVWGLSADSKNKEAAFAWMMWMHSKELAIQLSLFPSSLMDPYRFSQFESVQYRTAWPNAGLYLDTLREAGKYALVPNKILGGTEYDEIMDRIVSSVMGGTPVQAALDKAYDQMEDVTNRLGRDRVKATYKDLLKLQEDIRKLQ